jgi:hypothetical protein
MFLSLAKQAQENYNLGHFGGFSYGFFYPILATRVCEKAISGYFA